MKFGRMIEYTTSRREEVDALMDRWAATTQASRAARRVVVTADRDRAHAYVEFPSYEEAMRNSDLPETRDFAEQFAELRDSCPPFRNLDVLKEA